MRYGELSRRFECFGSEATIHLSYEESVPLAHGAPLSLKLTAREHGGFALEHPVASAAQAASAVQALLSDISERLTRFEPHSELCELNADGRREVPVSPLLMRFVRAAVWAAGASGGLVDAALLDELERCGYVCSMTPAVASRRRGLKGECRAARPRPHSPWPLVRCDESTGTVTRPPGTRFDGGGIVKGMAADIAALTLAEHPAFAVDCVGDVRIGGTARLARRITVEDPFDGETLTEFELRSGAVATSGILRRSWSSSSGESAHHLIDPARGRPAYTGVVQVTALAPTALEAEIRAKACLLAGPDSAGFWLPHGGVLVRNDGSFTVLPATNTIVDPDAVDAEELCR